MPRNGSGVYSLPAEYEAFSGERATALQHNSPLEDLRTDMNTARPIVAGGTGATTAEAARTSLGILGQTTPTDDTEGRYLQVGAFGLGAEAPVIGNASVTDESIAPGFYSYQTADGSSGGPSGVITATLIHTRRTTSGGEAQTLVNEGGDQEVYVRARTSGAWGAWNTQYSESNILGTVSQSGGSPTGSIIEKGSNANGDYTKFADGTMICSIVTFSVPFSNAGTCSGDWTFPAAFLNTPTVTATIRADTTSGTIAGSLDEIGPALWTNSGANATTARMQVRRINGLTDFVSGNSVTLQGITAIGKWY